ncbi:MAG: hypothetical protein CVU54_17100 [Deltaproteobacteria bacterium HGW-Deltaproteobacteria-12]|jgi:hypothetical protein|nr:MAG: hypothetical protein CVU54_17100 [Deltaproteobacteria bacterium HGW-Deltaproteobacteria-12]
MKKAFLYITGVAFLLSALAFAADKPLSPATAAGQVKANPVRIAKMNATGKVIEISDKAIKIERTVKNNVETMQFVLDKPTENIAVNDAVKIAYVEKDGNLLASRVAKIIPKKAGEKETFPGKAAPVKK